MIKVNTDKGAISVELEGSLQMLVADTGIILQAVYEGIKEQHENDAEAFRRIMLKLVNENAVMC